MSDRDASSGLQKNNVGFWMHNVSFAFEKTCKMMFFFAPNLFKSVHKIFFPVQGIPVPGFIILWTLWIVALRVYLYT